MTFTDEGYLLFTVGMTRKLGRWVWTLKKIFWQPPVYCALSFMSKNVLVNVIYCIFVSPSLFVSLIDLQIIQRGEGEKNPVIKIELMYSMFLNSIWETLLISYIKFGGTICSLRIAAPASICPGCVSRRPLRPLCPPPLPWRATATRQQEVFAPTFDLSLLAIWLTAEPPTARRSRLSLSHLPGDDEVR